MADKLLLGDTVPKQIEKINKAFDTVDEHTTTITELVGFAQQANVDFAQLQKVVTAHDTSIDEVSLTVKQANNTLTDYEERISTLESGSGGGSGGTNIPFVSGTQTATTASWKGVASSLTELKDGQTINYWLPHDSAANATLNLTLADGTTTGVVPCYYSGTTRLGTQYTKGTMLSLTYRKGVKIGTSTATYNGWWVDGADSTPYVTQYYTTANNRYPLLFRYTAGTTGTSNSNTYCRYCNDIYLNPYTGALYATMLAENDELLEEKYALKGEIPSITNTDGSISLTEYGFYVVFAPEGGAWSITINNTTMPIDSGILFVTIDENGYCVQFEYDGYMSQIYGELVYGELWISWDGLPFKYVKLAGG